MTYRITHIKMRLGMRYPADEAMNLFPWLAMAWYGIAWAIFCFRVMS